MIETRVRVATGFLLSGAVARAVAGTPDRGDARAVEPDGFQLESLRCLVRLADLLGIPASTVAAVGRLALSHLADECAATRVRALVRRADPAARASGDGEPSRASLLGVLLCRSLVGEAGRVERAARALRPSTVGERDSASARLSASAFDLDRVLRECAHVLSSEETLHARDAIARALQAVHAATVESATAVVARSCEQLARGLEASPAVAPALVHLAERTLRRAQAVIRRCRAAPARRAGDAEPEPGFRVQDVRRLAGQLEEAATELDDVRVMVDLAYEAYAFILREYETLAAAYPDLPATDLADGCVLRERLAAAGETVGQLQRLGLEAAGLAAEIEPARTALRTARWLIRASSAHGALPVVDFGREKVQGRVRRKGLRQVKPQPLRGEEAQRRGDVQPHS